MIMDAFRGVGGGSPERAIAALGGLGGEGRGSPHTSPAKRSFDVAFLTGHADPTSTGSSDTTENFSSGPNKVSRVGGGLRVSPTASLTSTPLSDVTEAHRQRGSDDAAPSSAFKKVAQRQQQGSPPLPVTVNHQVDALTSSWPPMTASFNAMSSLLNSGKSLAPLLATPGLLSNGLTSFLPPATPDRLNNNNLVEEYIKSQHHLLSTNKTAIGSRLSPTETLSRIRSSLYASDPYKLPFGGMNYGPLGPAPGGSSSLGPQVGGGLTASGPGVGLSQGPPGPSPIASLMPGNMGSLTLPAQNLCAKCNISFRMTSDLVYHMRTHHKRETDPYKKRRDEKLKCTICNESFRERHHLTRHMSAHQDRKEEVGSK